MTEFRDKRSKQITFWGWASLLGIVISSSGGLVAQRRRDKESLDNLNRTIATFQNTAETVKNTAKTVQEINRYAASLQDATIRVQYNLDCTFDRKPCGKWPQTEDTLRRERVIISFFVDPLDADEYVNEGYHKVDLLWNAQRPADSHEQGVVIRGRGWLLDNIDGYKPSTNEAPSGRILSLFDLPNTSFLVQGENSQFLGIPIESVLFAILPCPGNIVSLSSILKQKDLHRERRQAAFSASPEPVREI